MVVRGAAPASDAGHTVVLEFARRGATAWSQLGSTTVGSTGAFSLAGRLERSGAVRVVDTSDGSLTPFVAGRITGGASGDEQRRAGGRHSPHAGSRPARSAFSAARRSTFAGGCCRPFRDARSVSRRCRAVRGTRSPPRAPVPPGRFALRYVAGAPGQARLRVRFGGDRLNARSTAHAGQMTVYRQAGASWYYDAGNTACGFHAQYGVANRTLPCGTKVAFRYGGRSVTATVDDRGPYVGGRDWDLSQTTAGALGFGGVGEVWSSQ